MLSNTAMGDTLWVTAALQYLHETSPKTRVTVLSSVIGGQALLNNPYIYELWIDQKSLFGKLRNFIAVLRTPFSETFNFHTSKRFIAYVGYLGSPGRYFGIYPECKASGILNGGIDSPEFETLHKIQMRIRLLAKYLNLNLPSPGNQYYLSVYPQQIDQEKAKVLIGYAQGKKYIFIQPGASIRAKQWHPDFFRQVVMWLDQNEFYCVFAGNQRELEPIEAITKGCKNVLKLGSHNMVMELAAVIDLCELVVTNDTGPMHIAEALNKAMLCFFWENHVIPAKPITKNRLKIYESKKTSDYITEPRPEEVIADIQSFLSERQKLY
ncbi:glycosyltransferase family 9 protein [Caedibacter taeniospiralis]|uniref:glycosyltransferase family 9 protein n=1 Tax=Caedibacter taeniospiralis TaxID=28907 RepID=UPI0037BFBC74